MGQFKRRIFLFFESKKGIVLPLKCGKVLPRKHGKVLPHEYGNTIPHLLSQTIVLYLMQLALEVVGRHFSLIDTWSRDYHSIVSIRSIKMTFCHAHENLIRIESPLTCNNLIVLLIHRLQNPLLKSSQMSQLLNSCWN